MSNFDESLEKSKKTLDRSKKTVKGTVNLFFTLFFKELKKKIKTIIKLIMAKITIFVMIIVGILIPIFLILFLLANSEKLISMGINIIVNVVRDEFGRITGINMNPIPGININSNSLSKYVVSFRTKEEKLEIINRIKAESELATNGISNNLGMDDIFGKYTQSSTDKILSYIPFVDDEEQNFQTLKDTIERLYRMKISRKSSDWFIFDMIKSGYIKYKFDIDEKFEKDLLSKTNSQYKTIEELNNSFREGFGYYIKEKPSSMSGSQSVPAKFINLSDKNTVKSATGGQIIDYVVKGNEQNIADMLTFFYKRNAIETAIIANNGTPATALNNDARFELFKDRDTYTKDIGKKRIDDLSILLNDLESQYIDDLYNKLGENAVVITTEFEKNQSDTILKKLILRNYIREQYNFYSKVSNIGFTISFSVIGRIAEKGTDYDSCKVTQLYGQSNASTAYPKGLHNGYDFVYSWNESRSVTMRSIVDGTVVKSGPQRGGNGVFIGNYVLIRADEMGVSKDGKPVVGYIEYLHLSDSWIISEGVKVTTGDEIGVQGDSGIGSMPIHLHMSLFLSEESGPCSGVLSSTKGYACAVTSDEFFKALSSENIIRTINNECYAEWSTGGGIGKKF